jgi:hypothetical protein
MNVCLPLYQISFVSARWKRKVGREIWCGSRQKNVEMTKRGILLNNQIYFILLAALSSLVNKDMCTAILHDHIRVLELLVSVQCCLNCFGKFSMFSYFTEFFFHVQFFSDTSTPRFDLFLPSTLYLAFSPRSVRILVSCAQEKSLACVPVFEKCEKYIKRKEKDSEKDFISSFLIEAFQQSAIGTDVLSAEVKSQR